MKRAIAFLCAVMMCLCLTACTSSKSVKDNKSSQTVNSQSASSQKQDGLTESQIKSATVKALKDLIKKKYPVADPGSSTFAINKTTRKSNGDYIVYGTVRLYDKYGKLTTGYYDGSGSYTKSFEIKINGKTGTAYYGGEIR